MKFVEAILRAALLVAVLGACAAPSPRGEVAVVSFTKNDNTVESRTVALKNMPDGAARLVVPADSVPSDAKLLDIVHQNFTAQKGEDGFWLFPRGEYGVFDSDKGVFSFKSLIMPFYGIQTPRGTYIGIVKGFRFGLFTRVSADKGKYTLSMRSDLYKTPGIKPYEDIIIDYYKLEGNDANYSGIARFFRKYQLDRGACRLLRDRVKERPDLAYQADSIPIRIQYHAAKQKPKEGKKEHYTVADEPPMKVFLNFEDSVKFVKAVRDAGIDKATFCSAGWQSGGYDGRFPDIFPIDAELGGEIRPDRKAGCVDSGIEPALELRDDIALFVDRSFAHGVTPKNSRQPWGGTSASIRPESASSNCPLQCSLNAVSGPSCRIANRRGSSPKLKNP